MLFDEQFDMQATMFQPVGGMDRIPYAFAKSLGDIVMYGAPVTEIRKAGKGVKVGYTKNGEAKMIAADFCVCAMPLTILKKDAERFQRALQEGDCGVHLLACVQDRVGEAGASGSRTTTSMAGWSL